MKVHEQILTLLKGCSSQKPMRFNDLIIESGYCAEPLHLLLDQMYDARQINQAIVTRAGVKQREVWPVSVVNSANPYRSGVATSPMLPPRRNEAKAINPESATMNTNQDKTNAAPDEKPRALQVLEFIEANPGCNTKEINANFAFSFIKPVVYISKHIEAQKVRRTYISKRNAVYHIEAGHNATSIYGLGVKGNHGHRAKAVVIASRDDFAIDAINTLFDLLPPQSAIVIGRANGELQIEIEADVFGTPVAKTVLINQVIETLNALHIVTVDMS